MIIFGFAVGSVVINAVVDRIVLLAIAMHQVHNANSAYQTGHSTAVLFLNQLYRLRVLFVLNTVVDDQIAAFGIMDQVPDQRPNLPYRDPVSF